jgi:hypothetical protein
MFALVAKPWKKAGDTEEATDDAKLSWPHPVAFLRIMLPGVTLSATAATTFGVGALMSSRASLTAAMMEAHIAGVLAYLALGSFSRATRRFISHTITSIDEQKAKCHPQPSRP